MSQLQDGCRIEDELNELDSACKGGSRVFSAQIREAICDVHKHLKM